MWKKLIQLFIWFYIYSFFFFKCVRYFSLTIFLFEKLNQIYIDTGVTDIYNIGVKRQSDKLGHPDSITASHEQLQKLRGQNSQDWIVSFYKVHSINDKNKKNKRIGKIYIFS